MYTRRANPSPGHGIGADDPRNGESRLAEIYAVLIVGCVLSTIAVGLRSYTRRVILRTFGLDDGVMVAAQALIVASAVSIGFGEHSYSSVMKL